ncbi:MAG: hypothetical protein JXR37_20765 [Kiritimatiellae bacterium]|nr:hypothetical protein [Kiritimatiellia bacterium]
MRKRRRYRGMAAETAVCLLALATACAAGGNGQTYLPWTAGTPQPVRFAPALALHVNAHSRTKNPGEVAQKQYEEWVAAGAWDWVNTARRHWLMLYCPLYNWQSFYADEQVRPQEPSNPDDPGYSWRMMDEFLNMDAVQKDGAKWLIRINWQHWGMGTPQWLMNGQGAVNNEDNGLGGGMLFPDAVKRNEGLPAFQRLYVQKEFRYFAEAFGKRYRDRTELGGIIFDEIQLETNRLVQASDFDRDAYLRGHDNAMLDFAKSVPNTAICIYQVWANTRKEQLAPGVNIGFGCADARLWVATLAATGPWYPDSAPASTGNSYYTSAMVYNYAAKKPHGGSRHFWVVGSEANGWKQRDRIPEACGGSQNILGHAAGTYKKCHEIEPDDFMQYHACVPRNPGGYPGLNSVPGIVHASWLIITDSTKSGRCSSGEMPRTKDKWAEAFRKLGPQGLDCVVEEPFGWDGQIKSSVIRHQ